MNKNTNLKSIGYTLLCSIILTSHTSIAAASEPETTKSKTSADTKTHGEGKKPTGCDMEQITIWSNGTKNSFRSKDLITLPPVGNVEKSARRIIQKDRPVLPVDRFIADYPGSKKITFMTCDSIDHYEVTTEEVASNKKTYILTFNSAGRTRLVKFEKGEYRNDYKTVAKNIVSIKLSQ